MHKAKFGFLLFLLVILTVFPLLNPKNAFAIVSCSIQNGQTSFGTGGTISLTAGGFMFPNTPYNIYVTDTSTFVETTLISYTPGNGNSINLSAPIPSVNAGTYNLMIGSVNGPGGISDMAFCQRNITITNGGGGAPSTPSCSLSPATITSGQDLSVFGTNLKPNTSYSILLDGLPLAGTGAQSNSSGSYSRTMVLVASTDSHSVSLGDGTSTTPVNCGAVTVRSASGATGQFVSGENPCGPTGTLCKTALGNIPTKPAAFTEALINIAVGIAGGLALIIMVRGSIKLLMSAGDQQKIQDGRDMIIGAVAGLLFLIFSVLILRFLGSDLLNLFSYR